MLEVQGPALVLGGEDWNDAQAQMEYELSAENMWPIKGPLVIDLHHFAPFFERFRPC